MNEFDDFEVEGPAGGIEQALYALAANGPLIDSPSGTAPCSCVRRCRLLVVVAEDDLGDADRLVAALALDRGRHRHLRAASLDLVELDRPRRSRAGASRPDGRREAHPVQARS